MFTKNHDRFIVCLISLSFISFLLYPFSISAQDNKYENKSSLLQKETDGELMIGIADSNGIIVPFAVYAGGKWTNPWPEEDYDAYERIEDIPKSWYSPLEKIPEKWNVIYKDGNTGTMNISKPARIHSWCSHNRWALIGEETKKEYTGTRYGYDYRINNSDGLFLVTTAQQTGSGMKAPDNQSYEYSEIYKMVDAYISNHEQVGNFPVPADERKAVKTELTNIARNETPLDCCFMYYVEASKNYKDDNKDNPLDHYVSYFNGWILKDGNNDLSFINQNFELIKNELLVPGETPIGILTLDGRSYWIFSRIVYEGEVWFILDVSASSIITVLKVYAGGC